MLEVCPSIAGATPTCEIHPLAIGGRADPVRLVFTARPGPAIAVGLLDLGEQFRMVLNEVDLVDPPADMPRLPVARALWEPRPGLRVAAESWLLAGGPHHTSLSTALRREHLEEPRRDGGHRPRHHRRPDDGGGCRGAPLEPGLSPARPGRLARRASHQVRGERRRTERHHRIRARRRTRRTKQREVPHETRTCALDDPGVHSGPRVGGGGDLQMREPGVHLPWRLPALVASLILVVAACGSSTSSASPGASGATGATDGQFCKGMKIVFFPGGTPGGGFETVVYNGAKAAQAAFGPRRDLPSGPTGIQNKMITQFQQAVASQSLTASR